MTEDEFKAKIFQFLTLLMTDMDAAEAMMGEGFVWDNFLPEHVPFGGHYVGLVGMKQFFAEMGENWVIGEIVFSDIIISQDGKRCAAVGVEKNGKAIPTGKVTDMEFVWIFRTNEAGQFTYVREYNDTNVMGQAFA